MLCSSWLFAVKLNEYLLKCQETWGLSMSYVETKRGRVAGETMARNPQLVCPSAATLSAACMAHAPSIILGHLEKWVDIPKVKVSDLVSCECASTWRAAEGVSGWLLDQRRREGMFVLVDV